MKQEDIIRMARSVMEERGGSRMDDEEDLIVYSLQLAALVAAAEREACAKVAGEFAQAWWSIHCASNKHMETTRKAHDAFCALQATIRARGQA